MTHVVDSIAERFKELLTDTTDAQDRITRDLSASERFQARDDLPAIDIRIGEEDEYPRPVAGKYRAIVSIIVNLFASDAENVSSAVLDLRSQVDRAIMQATVWPAGFASITRGLASPIARDSEGAIPISAISLTYRVAYQHDYFDPESQ